MVQLKQENIIHKHENIKTQGEGGIKHSKKRCYTPFMRHTIRDEIKEARYMYTKKTSQHPML